MRLRTFNFLRARRSLLVLLVGITAALSFLMVGGSRAQQPDSRPRQTGNATPTPTPQPTPIPQTGRAGASRRNWERRRRRRS